MKLYRLLPHSKAIIASPDDLWTKCRQYKIGEPVSWGNETIRISSPKEMTDLVYAPTPFRQFFSAAFKEFFDSYIVEEPIEWNPVTIINNGIEYQYYALAFTRPMEEIVCVEQSCI